MASSQSPNRVFFSNLDRSLNDTTTDFTINFDTPITNSYNYEVVGASFPNLFKPFATYETILYFYHEDFNNGNIAIGIPFSTTQVGGTGEASPPASRAIYIDKRYFSDGTELATYLTNWLASLSTSWPTEASGLQPFFYTGDSPVDGVRTFLASEVATGITFSNLSFAFDDLTLGGTLRLDFADSTIGGKIIRIASTLDYGSLAGDMTLPSLMGFKLGYTDQINEGFGSLVKFDVTNNHFRLGALVGSNNVVMDIMIPPNDYTSAGLAETLEAVIAQTATDTGRTSFFGGLQVTQAGNILSFVYPSPAGVTSYFLNFNVSNSAQTSMGFSNALYTDSAGATRTAESTVALVGQTPTPDDHIATSTINLTRTSNVFMGSSLSSGESMTSAGRKDILFAIPVSAGIGALQQYQSSLSGIVINRPPSSIRSLRMTMLDDLFQVLEPLPPNASVNVEIHFAYADDVKASSTDLRSTNLYA